MSNKGQSTPRVVCCAIPIARSAGKVLVVTSRKQPDNWVLPKGEWESSDGGLEAAASREALEEGHTLCPSVYRPPFLTTSFPPLHPIHIGRRDVAACPHNRAAPSHNVQWSPRLPSPSSPPAGVRGTITRFVTTISSASSTYHFYELDVQTLDADWLESEERRREWVDYAEASRRLAWKVVLAQGLALSTIALAKR